MKFMQWFKDIIDADSSVSSKRFCGVIGWLFSIVIILYCTIFVIQAPTIMEVFLLSVVGLLGVDSVTNIWKSEQNQQKTINDKNEETS